MGRGRGECPGWSLSKASAMSGKGSAYGQSISSQDPADRDIETLTAVPQPTAPCRLGLILGRFRLRLWVDSQSTEGASHDKAEISRRLGVVPNADIPTLRLGHVADARCLELVLIVR